MFAKGLADFGKRLSGDKEAVFVIAYEVFMQHGCAIREIAQLLLQDLMDEWTVVASVGLKVEGVSGIEIGLEHTGHVADLGEQSCCVMTRKKVDFVDSDLTSGSPCVKDKSAPTD